MIHYDYIRKVYTLNGVEIAADQMIDPYQVGYWFGRTNVSVLDINRTRQDIVGHDDFSLGYADGVGDREAA